MLLIQRLSVSAVPAVICSRKKMNEHTEQKIGVVGGGLMGHGIAYLFAAPVITSMCLNLFLRFATHCRSGCRRSSTCSAMVHRCCIESQRTIRLLPLCAVPSGSSKPRR